MSTREELEHIIQDATAKLQALPEPDETAQGADFLARVMDNKREFDCWDIPLDVPFTFRYCCFFRHELERLSLVCFELEEELSEYGTRSSEEQSGFDINRKVRENIANKLTVLLKKEEEMLEE